MRKLLLAAAMVLGAMAPARASQISASCSADSVQLFCNGVTPGATTQWTGQNYYFQQVVFGSTNTGAGYSIVSSSGIQMQAGFLVIGAGGVVWADGSVSTSALAGGGGGGGETAYFGPAKTFGSSVTATGLLIKPTSGDSQITVDTTGTGNNAIVAFYSNGSIKAEIYKNTGDALVLDTQTGTDIIFKPGNNEAMRAVQSTGYVGIGTTTPSAPLQVIGEIKASTFTAVGSAFIVGATTIQANSANFGGTANFNNQVTIGESGAFYSLVTSTGIFLVAGGVTAPFFNGTHLGDGSLLSGVATAAQLNTVAASTASLQNQVNALNTSTGTIAVSTNSLQNQINAINTSTGGFITGSGTANKLTKFSGSVAVSTSQITDDGTDINATAKAGVTGGVVTIKGGSGTTGFGGEVNISGGDSATNQGGNLNLSSGNGAVQPGSVISKIGGVEEVRVHINGYLGVNQASPPARLSVVDIGGLNTFTGLDNNYLVVVATGDPVGKWVMAITTSGKVSFGGLDPALQTNKYTLNGGTLAVVGAISSTGTISANNFMGDGFHINNLVVAVSSQPSGSISVASTSEITVTTVTASVRGGRPYMLSFTVDINNAVGAGRTYTLRLREEGALVSAVYLNDVGGLINETIHIHALVTAGAGAAGSRNFEASIQGSSAIGTQTADSRELSIIEY